jgi:hypothetical protein
MASGNALVLSSKVSVSDSLAPAYDAWFEQEGKFIFASEVEAFKASFAFAVQASD